MSTIILASGSYLKNFIMGKSNLAYDVMEANIDETIFDNCPVEDRVRLLAEKKCQVIAAKMADATVIAADTLTCDENGTVFTKPKANTDPLSEALKLSGRTIGVYTGCCIIKPGQKPVSTTTYTRLTYQEFDSNRLAALLKEDDASVRSGALGIFFDAPGFTLIESIEGSYTGAYGLPMEFVYANLS